MARKLLGGGRNLKILTCGILAVILYNGVFAVESLSPKKLSNLFDTSAVDITLQNEVYSELIDRPAVENVSSKFWGVRERFYADATAKKWRLTGRVGFKVKDSIVFTEDGSYLNAYLSPLDWLTLAGGLKMEWRLSGAKMWARDYGMDNDNGYFADKSVALTLKTKNNMVFGASVPIVTNENEKFQLNLGIAYPIKLFTASVLYKGNFEEKENTIGLYLDVANLKNFDMAFGVTGHFTTFENSYGLIDGAIRYTFPNVELAADVSYGFSGNGSGRPLILALNADTKLEDVNMNVFLRGIVGINVFTETNDIRKSVNVKDALSFIVKSGFRYRINPKHYISAGLDITLARPALARTMIFGVAIPVSWKYFIL